MNTKQFLRIGYPVLVIVAFAAIMWFFIRPRVESSLIDARTHTIRTIASHTVRDAESWIASRLSIVSAAASHISVRPREGEELVATLIRQHPNLRMIRIYGPNSVDELVGRSARGTDDSLTFAETEWEGWKGVDGAHIAMMRDRKDSLTVATRIAFVIGEYQFYCSALWDGEPLAQAFTSTPVPDNSRIIVNGPRGLLWRNVDSNAADNDERIETTAAFEHCSAVLSVAFPTAPVFTPLRAAFRDSLLLLLLLLLPGIIVGVVRWRRSPQADA